MIERSKSREKMPKPDARIETKSLFEIWEIEQLPEQEQLAMRNAIAAWANSNNPEFPAGSCAIAENGEMSVKHNHTNEPGKGQEGHAEMLAIRDLFESVPRAEKKLKILALAATYPNSPLIRSTEKYGRQVKNLNDIDVPRICGRCLKFASDATGNNVPYSDPSITPRPEPTTIDPTILIYTATGQVLRTKLSALYPMPHIPHQMDAKMWEKRKDDSKAPDQSMGSGGK